MPTVFSDCYECNYHKCLGLDHKFNERYKKNLEKQLILLSLGIPVEICQKIIKISHNLTKCSYCNTQLCKEHTDRGIDNGKHYRGKGIMCDQCCWWEIS